MTTENMIVILIIMVMCLYGLIIVMLDGIEQKIEDLNSKIDRNSKK